VRQGKELMGSSDISEREPAFRVSLRRGIDDPKVLAKFLKTDRLCAFLKPGMGSGAAVDFDNLRIGVTAADGITGMGVGPISEPRM